MRNGGIGRGWYEDDPTAIQITQDEIEFNELVKGLLKSKLDEVWKLFGIRHKERQDAIEKT